MAKFIKNIQNFASQYDLWHENTKIIVGVSGGPDSCCLLDVLSVLAKKYGFKIHVAHLNYSLRGKDSDRDEEFVKKLAERYGFECSVLRPKKESYLGNLEKSLRDIRYEFFEKLRVEKRYDFVAVAHSQDDQVETVLMHMLRGAGLNGLSAMRPRSSYIIRPLLKTGRKEILAYLKERRLDFCIDSTNEQCEMTRNRIRHGLIPFLEKEFNSSVKQVLGELSFSIADDYSYIVERAKNFSFKRSGNNIEFSATVLLECPISIQRQILRNMILNLKMNLTNIHSRHIDEMLKLVKSSKSKHQKAFISGLKIMKNGDKVSVMF